MFWTILRTGLSLSIFCVIFGTFAAPHLQETPTPTIEFFRVVEEVTKVRVVSPVRVRLEPGTSAGATTVLRTAEVNEEFEVRQDIERVALDGYTWIPILAEGQEAWVGLEGFLQPLIETQHLPISHAEVEVAMTSVLPEGATVREAIDGQLWALNEVGNRVAVWDWGSNDRPARWIGSEDSLWSPEFPYMRQLSTMIFLTTDMSKHPDNVHIVEWVATPEDTENGWREFWTRTYFDLITFHYRNSSSGEPIYTKSVDQRTFAEVFGVDPQTITLDEFRIVFDQIWFGGQNLPLVPIHVPNSSVIKWGNPNLPVEVVAVSDLRDGYPMHVYRYGTNGLPKDAYGVDVLEDYGTIRIYYRVDTNFDSAWSGGFFAGLYGLERTIVRNSFFENPSDGPVLAFSEIMWFAFGFRQDANGDWYGDPIEAS